MKGLSVCIPIYNFNCIRAVKTICEQIEYLSIAAEVLIIDDASPKELLDLENFSNPYYSYKKLNKNVGRSKIRNLLAEKAKFEHLLFLDGDSGIPENFILNYIAEIKKHPNSILCGGRLHKKNKDKNRKLRYQYGVKFEDQKALVRSKKPYHSFMTNNFVSTKEIIKKTPFNEDILDYGHEDTFFSYELKKNALPIIHFDNPLIHLDLDTNIDFIKKTKNGLKNLILLQSKYPDFTNHSKILNLIRRYRILRLKISKIASIRLSKVFEFISTRTGNTYSFQLFKLCYTISLYK